MLSGFSRDRIRRTEGGGPDMGRWAARIALYLGISHLIGTVVGRAGTLDQRKSGTWIDLPSILAGCRHASSLNICAHSFGAGNTGYPLALMSMGLKSEIKSAPGN